MVSYSKMFLDKFSNSFLVRQHTTCRLGVRAVVQPLIKSLLWLVKIWQLVTLSAGCSVPSKRYVHQEVTPLEWNLFLVLRSLTRPLYERLKLSSDKHLTWKTCFILGLELAQKG